MTSNADATDTLKTAAKDATGAVRNTARTKATEMASDMRDGALHQADKAAIAARDRAEQFEAQSVQALAMGVLADTITRTTELVRDKPVDALIEEASDFARRNPAIVLGGAALLGFAAARFLKSGATPDGPAHSDDPWVGHLHPDSAETEVS